MSKKNSKSSKKSGKGHGIRVVEGDAPILETEQAPEVVETTEPTTEVASEIPAEGYDTAQDYIAAEFPVDGLSLNSLRTPSETAVAEMAKSIQRVGLQNAIVVDANGNVISGNTRLLAFRKLGRKTIPARFAVDAKGNPITKDMAEATVAGLAENLARTQMTPVELGRQAIDAIKRGVAGSEKELANRIGVSTPVLNKAITIASKAAGPVADAIASGELTVDAGVAIVSRCQTEELQRDALELIRNAVKGKGGSKITTEDVDAHVPKKDRSERREGRSRAGRPVEKMVLPGEATNVDESGIRAMLRKTSDGGMMIVLDIQIPVDVKTFARFDLETQIQKSAAKIKATDARSALETARQALGV